MSAERLALVFAAVFALACNPERPEAYMESCDTAACPEGQGLVCVDYGAARGEPRKLCTFECSDNEDCPIQKCESYNQISCGGVEGSGLSSCSWCGAEVPGYCRMDCEW